MMLRGRSFWNTQEGGSLQSRRHRRDTVATEPRADLSLVSGHGRETSYPRARSQLSGFRNPAIASGSSTLVKFPLIFKGSGAAGLE